MPKEQKDRPAISDAQIEQIKSLAETIRYGTLTLVFQDGLLTQIDRNEKIRITES